MTGWRRHLALGGGYVIFFAVVFTLTFYLSFDPSMFAPSIIRHLKAGSPWLKDREVKIGEISLYHLTGITFKDITISGAAHGDTSQPPITIRRLTLAPRLRSLPRTLAAVRAGKPPPISLSAYILEIADGRIKGSLTSAPDKFHFEALIKDPIQLAKLSVPSDKLGKTRLAGALTGEINLDFKDPKDPATGRGDIKLEIDKPEVKALTYATLPIFDDLVMDKATLVLKLDGGKVTIDTLKLQGKDLPLNLQGTIVLNQHLGQSAADVKGTVLLGEAFKARNPIAASYMKDNNNYVYTGPLSGMVPPGVF